MLDVSPPATCATATIAGRQAPSRYLKASVSIGVLREQAFGKEKVLVQHSCLDRRDASTRRPGRRQRDGRLLAVRHNAERFPEDFMFELAPGAWEVLRSQIVTSKEGRGGRRYAPYVFTEQGVAMLSSVLRPARAIAVNVEIMRAFVRLREVLTANKGLAKQFAALEARIDKRLANQDQAIVEILQAIRKLMAAPATGPTRKIGFVRRDLSGLPETRVVKILESNSKRAPPCLEP